MAKKATKTVREWRISIVGAKSKYLGHVEAPDEKAAIEKRWKNSGSTRRTGSG